MQIEHYVRQIAPPEFDFSALFRNGRFAFLRPTGESGSDYHLTLVVLRMSVG
jgi:hypothetical protein